MLIKTSNYFIKTDLPPMVESATKIYTHQEFVRFINLLTDANLSLRRAKFTLHRIETLQELYYGVDFEE